MLDSGQHWRESGTGKQKPLGQVREHGQLQSLHRGPEPGQRKKVARSGEEGLNHYISFNDHETASSSQTGVQKVQQFPVALELAEFTDTV